MTRLETKKFHNSAKRQILKEKEDIEVRKAAFNTALLARRDTFAEILCRKLEVYATKCLPVLASPVL